ncbi:MAG: hypothetical protein GY941_10565, partial [Planctomycetes bacterium]|nr:hypothetical protein [Planctomycetota bacterium]
MDSLQEDEDTLKETLLEMISRDSNTWNIAQPDAAYSKGFLVGQKYVLGIEYEELLTPEEIEKENEIDT